MPQPPARQSSMVSSQDAPCGAGGPGRSAIWTGGRVVCFEMGGHKLNCSKLRELLRRKPFRNQCQIKPDSRRPHLEGWHFRLQVVAQ
jgi:hypothetical protein